MTEREHLYYCIKQQFVLSYTTYQSKKTLNGTKLNKHVFYGIYHIMYTQI